MKKYGYYYIAICILNYSMFNKSTDEQAIHMSEKVFWGCEEK